MTDNQQIDSNDLIAEQNPEEDLENFVEVEVEGIFVKHDFDHIILNDDEIEKFTNG